MADKVTCVFCGDECKQAPTERGWVKVDRTTGLHFHCADSVSSIPHTPTPALREAVDFRKLLEKICVLVNPVTAYHRHGRKLNDISKHHLDKLCNFQIDCEAALAAAPAPDETAICNSCIVEKTATEYWRTFCKNCDKVSATRRDIMVNGSRPHSK